MVMCTAHNQQTNAISPLCTRGLLERMLFAAKECMGLEFCIGAEIEWQLFHRETKDGMPQPVDWSTFANTTSLNEQEDFISMLYDQLADQDIPVELLHAESAPSQLEVVLRYSTNVMQLADDIVLCRETITSCAKSHGYKALFLPKTSMMTAGNGLHLHFSFRHVESTLDNTFSDPSQPSGISLEGQSFIEGILAHLSSLLSFSLPTSNSFRRVGPGCWTGSVVGWSTEDKEVPIRVCRDLSTRAITNVEYKLSDATANIYLELAMIISAGLDGIQKRRALRAEAGGGSESESLPTSLAESLNKLKANELLPSLLGPELMTAYVAVRESVLKSEKASLEAELLDAFNKA
jgi:glutamine synthetase